MFVLALSAVAKTTLPSLVTTIPKFTTRTIVMGKPINSRNILNMGKAAINTSSIQCAHISDLGLHILMEAQSQAVEAQVGREVANVKLIMIEVYLGL
jgi:hypothetical protein